jgi:DNA-binding GntR family transcriptional regulator
MTPLMPQPGEGQLPRQNAAQTPPYEKIRDAIISGELAAGYPLVEATLARWCDVSRTPIREALSRLVNDGLAVRGRRGLIVREKDDAEILDIYQTRIALEQTAAQMAAERRTAQDLIVMRSWAQEMADAGPDDLERTAHANSQLHRAIWNASRNNSLIDLLERLVTYISQYPADTLSYPGRRHQAQADHLALIAAIEQRDVDGAGELARQHFTGARDIRLALWQSAVVTSEETAERYRRNWTR